jgi:hypothetical protein
LLRVAVRRAGAFLAAGLLAAGLLAELDLLAAVVLRAVLDREAVAGLRAAVFVGVTAAANFSRSLSTCLFVFLAFDWSALSALAMSRYAAWLPFSMSLPIEESATPASSSDFSNFAVARSTCLRVAAELGVALRAAGRRADELVFFAGGM